MGLIMNSVVSFYSLTCFFLQLD